MEKDKRLTPREIDIIKLSAQGLTYKEIGEKLYISHRTVQSILINLYSKLKLSNKVALIAWAYQNKIL